MAVTTSKTNIMTIIQEDGSDPSGAGGKIINDNFKKIDDLFDGDDCKSALVANSLASAPSIAANTGFSRHNATGSSYRITSGGVSYPVAIWGASFQTGAQTEGGYSWVTMAPIAKVPPYGPLMYRIMATIAPNTEQDRPIYLECIIGGYNGYFNTAAEVEGSVTYSSSGQWTLGYASDIGGTPGHHRTIYFGTENGSLYCGACMEDDWGSIYNALVMHVTVISLYSDDTPFTNTNIYYYDHGDDSNSS